MSKILRNFQQYFEATLNKFVNILETLKNILKKYLWGLE